MGLGLVVISRSFFNQLACEGQPINFRLEPTAEQQIYGERIVSQIFVSPRANLNRIDLMFQTYQRSNSHDVILKLFEVSENTDNLWQNLNIVQEFSVNASLLTDRVWHPFTFEPIANSAHKTYLIQIQSPHAMPGNAITVGGIEWDTYAPGLAFLGPTPVRADITFRACYPMTMFEKLQVLAHQITQNRPAMWGNATFYVTILISYTVLVIGLFWVLGKLVLSE